MPLTRCASRRGHGWPTPSRGRARFAGSGSRAQGVGVGATRATAWAGVLRTPRSVVARCARAPDDIAEGADACRMHAAPRARCPALVVGALRRACGCVAPLARAACPGGGRRRCGAAGAATRRSLSSGVARACDAVLRPPGTHCGQLCHGLDLAQANLGVGCRRERCSSNLVRRCSAEFGAPPPPALRPDCPTPWSTLSRTSPQLPPPPD